MSSLFTILFISWLAGIAAFIGGTIAKLENIPETLAKQQTIHGIIAFGGGILLAAVAFALLPEGMVKLSPPLLALTFCAGGISFCLLDAYLSKTGGTKAQLLAMLMDFIPEALSLGAVFGNNPRLGMLLAAFIGIQNLPEGFNAFREMQAAGNKARSTLAFLFAVSFLGPIAAALGYFFLQDQSELTASIMAFAGGGILYLIFQDIAPQSTLQKHWSPPLGAVLGFLVGIMGNVLIH